MKLFRRKIGGVWHVSYCSLGSRVRKSTGCQDRKAAEQAAAQMVRDDERRSVGLSVPDRSAGIVAASEHVRGYCDALARRRRDALHVAKTKILLDRLIHMGRWNSLESITPESIDRVLLEFSEGKKAKTSNNARASLLAFLRFAVRIRLLTALPAFPEPLHPRRAS